MPDRSEERIEKKLIVSFNKDGEDNLGLTRNLSMNGLCINTDGELPPHCEVNVSVAIPGDVINLRGEVVWFLLTSEQGEDILDTIGIKITEAPKEYKQFLNVLIQQSAKSLNK